MPSLTVAHEIGDQFLTSLRGHRIVVDQPVADGGTDTGPSPVELFVASLTTCVAHYAHRFLVRHDLPDDPLDVTATWSMATGPARVDRIWLNVVLPPGVPAQSWPALRAVIAHCTVHNSIALPPDVEIDLVDGGVVAA